MLYLVRHGRTHANAGGRLQGRLDNPIDEVGRAQAAGLPSLVPTVDRVICSPSLRARQTAEVFGLQPEIDDRWLEMDYGVMDGTALTDVPPAMWHSWVTDPDFAPPGGETLREVAKRVYEACDELLQAARHSHVVVVSHATPVKVAMSWALGADIGIAWRSHVDQASVTRVLIRDGGPALAGFNLLPYS